MDGTICLKWVDDCKITGDPNDLQFELCIYHTEKLDENLVFCDNTIKPNECIEDLKSYFYTNNANIKDFLGKTLILVVRLKRVIYNVKTGLFKLHGDDTCEVAQATIEIPDCDNLGAQFCDKFKFKPDPVDCTITLKVVPGGTNTEHDLTKELVDKFNADGKIENGEKHCIILPSITDQTETLTLKYKLCVKDCCVTAEDGKLCVTNKSSVGKVDPYSMCTYENVSSTTTVLFVGQCKVQPAARVTHSNPRVAKSRAKTQIDTNAKITKQSHVGSRNIIRRKIIRK